MPRPSTADNLINSSRNLARDSAAGAGIEMAHFSQPTKIISDKNKNIFVCNAGDGSISKITSDYSQARFDRFIGEAGTNPAWTYEGHPSPFDANTANENGYRDPYGVRSPTGRVMIWMGGMDNIRDGVGKTPMGWRMGAHITHEFGDLGGVMTANTLAGIPDGTVAGNPAALAAYNSEAKQVHANFSPEFFILSHRHTDDWTLPHDFSSSFDPAQSGGGAAVGFNNSISGMLAEWSNSTTGKTEYRGLNAFYNSLPWVTVSTLGNFFASEAGMGIPFHTLKYNPGPFSLPFARPGAGYVALQETNLGGWRTNDGVQGHGSGAQPVSYTHLTLPTKA